MIVANISSFYGQCADAEHYYCSYRKIDNFIPAINKGCPIPCFGNEDLFRTIDENDAKILNKKDGGSSWVAGDKTQRFNTIEDINKALIEIAGDEDIFTFYESDFFKELLYRKDGVNHGIEYFGEIWSHVPNSCYKDLVPELETKIIKCENCGCIHAHDDVYEIGEHLGRELIKFYSKYDTFNRCCREYELKWNFVL
jgi:hypothetical protein